MLPLLPPAARIPNSSAFFLPVKVIIGLPFPNFYLDSGTATGDLIFQEFETSNSRGPQTVPAPSANNYMVTNQSKFLYIDTSPLNAHPAVIVGQCWTGCVR